MIEIRRAAIDDAKLIAEIGSKTFYNTFAEYNTAEDMRLFLEENYTTGKIINELQDTSACFYLAYKECVAAGFAKTGKNKPPQEIEQYNCIELERLYVLEEFHGQGIGIALMEHCIQQAKKEGCNMMWLGVWEHNPKAQMFYKRLGFEQFGDHIFMVGTDEQTDWLMKLELK